MHHNPPQLYVHLLHPAGAWHQQQQQQQQQCLQAAQLLLPGAGPQHLLQCQLLVPFLRQQLLLLAAREVLNLQGQLQTPAAAAAQVQPLPPAVVLQVLQALLLLQLLHPVLEPAAHLQQRDLPVPQQHPHHHEQLLLLLLLLVAADPPALVLLLLLLPSDPQLPLMPAPQLLLLLCPQALKVAASQPL
jgi:hypothetical protein